MVTDRLRERRERDRSCESSRTERGQVILIGAIALAFIILGVVIVFNGVVYTETLSSAQTGQSATTAEATETEIQQGIGCLIDKQDDDEQLEENITAFNDLYQNSTAHSSPAVVDISPKPGEIHAGDNATVTITYDSNELHYEQERTIEADCPEDS
ncbi:hypothetical protein [Natronorubrum thiooxidans]|uniref:Uncharacterized protein n=1 Tax=Natronorubrum thiooxidans TaxID=308853 RepID=A0A1N7DCR7_9EURY|nr:hypothetical protein [Natronorubrum thiooxidans]SIR73660.1 hypothetical protein SAMN05421752_102162 [Natronorubrum thiooxidans]